jgi:hypothetical protein
VTLPLSGAEPGGDGFGSVAPNSAISHNSRCATAHANAQVPPCWRTDQTRCRRVPSSFSNVAVHPGAAPGRPGRRWTPTMPDAERDFSTTRRASTSGTPASRSCSARQAAATARAAPSEPCSSSRKTLLADAPPGRRAVARQPGRPDERRIRTRPGDGPRPGRARSRRGRRTATLTRRPPQRTPRRGDRRKARTALTARRTGARFRILSLNVCWINDDVP